MVSLISLSQVTKRYENNRQPTVDRIRLEVSPGEAAAVMGPSGGKSTLLKLIAGMDRPTSGTVSVARQRIGMIFQFFILADEPTEALDTAAGRKGQ